MKTALVLSQFKSFSERQTTRQLKGEENRVERKQAKGWVIVGFSRLRWKTFKTVQVSQSLVVNLRCWNWRRIRCPEGWWRLQRSRSWWKRQQQPCQRREQWASSWSTTVFSPARPHCLAIFRPRSPTFPFPSVSGTPVWTSGPVESSWAKACFGSWPCLVLEPGDLHTWPDRTSGKLWPCSPEYGRPLFLRKLYSCRRCWIRTDTRPETLEPCPKTPHNLDRHWRLDKWSKRRFRIAWWVSIPDAPAWHPGWSQKALQARQ